MSETWRTFLNVAGSPLRTSSCGFFRTLSRRAHLKMAHQKIRDETIEHIDHLSSALKKIVLPLSVCYLCLGFFFGNNVIDSLFWVYWSLFIAISFQICYRLLELKTEKREIKTLHGLKNTLYCSLPHCSSSCYGRRDICFENHGAFSQRKIIGSLQHFLVVARLDFLRKPTTFIGKNSWGFLASYIWFHWILDTPKGRQNPLAKFDPSALCRIYGSA